MSHALSSCVLVESAGAFISWQGSLSSRFCLASFLSGLLVLSIVPLLTFFRLKPFPLAHLRSEYWIWEPKAGQSHYSEGCHLRVSWSVMPQGVTSALWPGSVLTATLSCLASRGLVGSSFFLFLTRPNSDIRWVFNDFETWLFSQLSRHSVSSRVIQTLRWLSFFLLTPHLSPPSSQDIILSWIHPNSSFFNVSPDAPVPQNFQHVHSENCLTVRE